VPEACSAAIKVVSKLKAQKAGKVYDALYPRYRALYQNLSEEFRHLAEMA
jgi:hypothetical protein